MVNKTTTKKTHKKKDHIIIQDSGFKDIKYIISQLNAFS